MAALDTGTHKFVVSGTSNLKDALPVDMRVAMERLLSDMGFTSFVISNSQPSDRTVLWWHKDISTVKRYHPIAGNWAPLTPAQYALHVMQRVVFAANAEGSLETGDLFPFYDVSAGETKKITKENLAVALGVSTGVQLGDGLFVKVAETVVSSESTYIDVLNISGFALYLVKAQGLRVTPDQAADAVAEQVGVQFGNNSTLYVSAGNYFDTSLAYLAISPSPADTSKRPNQIEYTYGEGIRRATNGTTRYGHFLFTLKNFNDATKRTRIHETDNNIMEMLTIDEQTAKIDGQNVEGEVRTAATAENRLRFLLPSGKKFSAGRISVFGIN